MARVKHIAIRTTDVEKTAAFYREAFDLKQVGLGQNGIYLSDGHLNIAILKFQPGADGEPVRLGVDHIGFQVEDVDATVAKLKTIDGKSLTDKTEVKAQRPFTSAILLRDQMPRSRRASHRHFAGRLGRSGLRSSSSGVQQFKVGPGTLNV